MSLKVADDGEALSVLKQFQGLGTQCVKGGGAKKMLQTAKTFVTKLVRYIE